MTRARNPNQDYTSFPLYLVEQDWKTITNKNLNVASRCNCIMNRLWNLGLRLPSEPTMAMITTCLLLVEPERFSDGFQMRTSYTSVKSLLKQFYRNLPTDAQGHGPRVLPATLAAVPQALANSAYGSTAQMNNHNLPNLPNGVTIEGLNQLCAMVPVRSTNRQVSLQLQLPKAAGFAGVGYAMGHWPMVMGAQAGFGQWGSAPALSLPPPPSSGLMPIFFEIESVHFHFASKHYSVDV